MLQWIFCMKFLLSFPPYDLQFYSFRRVFFFYLNQFFPTRAYEYITFLSIFITRSVLFVIFCSVLLVSTQQFLSILICVRVSQSVLTYTNTVFSFYLRCTYCLSFSPRFSLGTPRLHFAFLPSVKSRLSFLFADYIHSCVNFHHLLFSVLFSLMVLFASFSSFLF